MSEDTKLSDTTRAIVGDIFCLGEFEMEEVTDLELVERLIDFVSDDEPRRNLRLGLADVFGFKEPLVTDKELLDHVADMDKRSAKGTEAQRELNELRLHIAAVLDIRAVTLNNNKVIQAVKDVHFLAQRDGAKAKELKALLDRAFEVHEALVAILNGERTLAKLGLLTKLAPLEVER